MGTAQSEKSFLKQTTSIHLLKRIQQKENILVLAVFLFTEK